MAELRTYAIPSSLYRYRPLEADLARELGCIEHHYIYCPKFDTMNDPMEGSHRLSLRIAVSGTSKRLQRQVGQSQQKLGIAALSEVNDHEPMWAHYASQFRGMCVEYNTRRLLKGLDENVDLTRMAYSEKPPTILEGQESPDDRAKLSLSSKTVRWASEREWRLFLPEAGEAIYSGKNTVTRISLGARISDQDKEAVCELAQRMGIQVVQMKINAYNISFVSVRDG